MRAQNLQILQVSVSSNGLRTCAYTTLALIAFAANSLICRSALGTASIGALNFTAIRILSGAITIGIIGGVINGNFKKHPGNWISALALCMYATAFSLAFVDLSAGTGALILFGAVQTTMFIWGLRQGETPRLVQWCGLLVALAGFVVLMLPGLRKPSFTGALLMTIAGASWGIYSIRGRAVIDPIAVTGDNFLRALSIIIPIQLLFVNASEISANGVILATFSGSVTSGIGYALWYEALKNLTSTRAAVVQLFVPLIAMLGGIIFLHEHATIRLFIPTLMIIGGAGSYLLGKRRPPAYNPSSMNLGAFCQGRNGNLPC